MKKLCLLLVLCLYSYSGYSQAAAACTTPSWTSPSPSGGAATFNVTGFSGSNLADAGIQAASAGNGYSDRIAAIPTLNLRQGDAYSANITWSPFYSNQFLQTWIDFNDDGNFSVAEQVCPVSPSSLSTSNPQPFTITIPS
jgi:hypothetical protein